MYITAPRILQLAPQANTAWLFEVAERLEDMMPIYGVNTLLDRAHFMAQACWESGYFRRLEEGMNYTADRIAQVWPRLSARAHELAGNPVALANAAYANRNGNGDEASGDGSRFKGRGLFQITGRNNYVAAGYAATPADVAAPNGAVHTALQFWRERGCSTAANQDDCERVTRLINGPALDGLSHRIELTEAAKRIFA